MSVTRTPLHDAMVCISCGVPATVRGLDKAHVQSRARRPDLKEAADNQVLMCRRCHDAMDREHKFRLVIEDGRCIKEEWRDEEMAFVPIAITTVVVDEKRGHLVPDDSVLSAAASTVGVPAGNSGDGSSPSAAAPSAGLGGEAATPPQVSPSPPLTKEESDGEPETRNRNSVDSGAANRADTRHILRVPARVAPQTSPPLTHEQRVAIARHIKDAKQRHPFFAGDTANLWEEQLGEEDFWSIYADKFGYTYPSLRNVMRVCKRIPPPQRHVEMSFAHHEATQTFDIETRDAWLERSFEEEWPVKRLREELVAEGLLTAKPKTRKWSLEELRGLLMEFHPEENYGRVKGFLDWLEQA